MNFQHLRELIRIASAKKNFADACSSIQEIIFSLPKKDFIPIISEIGTIPEDISHDSSEEKLYAKVADIILSKCLQEMRLQSTVNKERTNCADVVAKSPIYKYTLVADAKAFRLSRTAKNQKDFKVKSLADWRGDHDYAILVCPFYQYPKSASQIYGQALDENVNIFAWEYFSILLEHNIVENENLNLSILWNMSAAISEITKNSDKNNSFLDQQNEILCSSLHLPKIIFDQKFEAFRSLIVCRGESEIIYWQYQIEQIKKYTQEQAIKELLISLKLSQKIASIRKFIDTLRN